MSDYDQVCAHCGESGRPGDPLWTRFGSSYHVTCRTPPPAVADLDDAVAPRIRCERHDGGQKFTIDPTGSAARAYGRREPIPEPPSPARVTEPSPEGPGASPVAEAGVVPVTPSRDDAPSGEGGSGVATPAAAGPGESSAALTYEQFLALSPGPDPEGPVVPGPSWGAGPGDSPRADCYRCSGTGLVAGGRPCSCVSCKHEVIAGRCVLCGDDSFPGDDEYTGDPDNYAPPSPDPAGVTPSLEQAGSGDLAAWDRALEGAELEGLAGRMRALAEAVDGPSLLDGRTMARLVRMAMGGGE